MLDENAWAEAVRHHLDVAFNVKDGATAEELASDWNLAREKVKLRLYREENLPSVPLVTWHVADGPRPRKFDSECGCADYLVNPPKRWSNAAFARLTWALTP